MGGGLEARGGRRAPQVGNRRWEIRSPQVARGRTTPSRWTINAAIKAAAKNLMIRKKTPATLCSRTAAPRGDPAGRPHPARHRGSPPAGGGSPVVLTPARPAATSSRKRPRSPGWAGVLLAPAPITADGLPPSSAPQSAQPCVPAPGQEWGAGTGDGGALCGRPHRCSRVGCYF